MTIIGCAAMLALLMTSALASGPTAAADRQVEARYSRDYHACMSWGAAAEGITSGLLDCTAAETERQDAQLNQAYKMVMLRLGTEPKATLRASERAWITARNARCHRAAAAEEGGTLANVIYADCILDETIKRTMWLEAYR